MIRYASVAVPVPLKKVFTYSFDDEKLNIVFGMRVVVPFHGRKTRGYVVDISDNNPLNEDVRVLPVSRVVDKQPVFTKELWNLALWMEKFYFSGRGEAIDTFIPNGKRDSAVVFPEDISASVSKNVTLTEDQKSAVDRILGKSSSIFYVFGVTGSGKTEVFLTCAEKIIASGHQVIYLVPEITLTHQLARQVKSRFSDNVAILHSAMTDAQRMTQWKKIMCGEVSLVIGARSAVFAPCPNLGMIIIDEEHENSYKSGNNPRYHARQVAQKRIAGCGGKLVMGSATPSLESWNLMKNSVIERIDLTKRVGGGVMPAVEIADMKNEKSMFGSLLIRRMTETLNAGKQVILFLNRRGFSYYFHCRSCGYELKCPHCDVAMTYHKSSGTMVCHYCGHRQSPVQVCPECGSRDVMYNGFGTEQVEQVLSGIFPHRNIARLDTDTVSADRSAIERTLDDFGRGKTDILIGTQMVAKGLNFPNVELVGIILADSGLLVPDFRAVERTFDLLVQVGGRSGRACGNGRVVIQTRMKDNSAIEKASLFRTEEFLDSELEMRRQTGCPPFSRMVCITVRSRKREIAADTASSIADEIRRNALVGVEVYGAQECPIEKVRENWRFQVILKSVKASDMLSVLSYVLDRIKVPSSVFLEVDVDPLELL